MVRAFIIATALVSSTATSAALIVTHDYGSFHAANPITESYDFNDVVLPLNDDYLPVASPYILGPVTFHNADAIYNDVGPAQYLGTGIGNDFSLVSLRGVRSVGFLLGAYYGASQVSVTIDHKIRDTFSIGGDDYPFLGLSSSGHITEIDFGGRFNELDFFQITVASAPGAVPEPTSWALMISGFGMIGTAMRRRSYRAA